MAIELGRIRPTSTPLAEQRVRTSPDTFGAGIGRALQQAGQQVAQVSQQWQQREEEKNKYDALIRLNRLNSELARDVFQMERDAPLGAPEHTNAVEELTRLKTKEFIESLPPALREEFLVRTEQSVNTFVNSAFQFQVKAEDTAFKTGYTDTLNAAITRVNNNPELIDTELAVLTEILNQAPITADDRATLIQDTAASLQEGMFYGELKQATSLGAYDSVVAATDIPDLGGALMNFVAGPESNGRYNVRYDGTATGATFDNFDRHPNIPVRRPDGRISTAAGKYQFTHTTWQHYAPLAGVTDFSPASQDKVAWYLMQEEYTKDTGRNLLADLQSLSGNPPEVDGFRPFKPGESIQNEDGTESTERTVTVQGPEGEWINVPSLWMTSQGAVELSDDEALDVALEYEQGAGIPFTRFETLEEAEKAAQTRSDGAGVDVGELIVKSLVNRWEAFENIQGSQVTDHFRGLVELASVPDPMTDARYEGIPADKRRTLSAQAEREGNAIRTQAQKQFEQGWEDDLSFRAATGMEPAGSIYTNAAILEMYDPNTAAERIRQRDAALESGKMFAQVKLAPPEEVNALLTDAAQAASNPDNFLWDQDRFSKLQKMVNERNKQLRKDGAGYVIQNDPVAADLFDNVDEDAAAYATYVIAEQARLGVPEYLRKVVPETLAQNMVAELVARPLDEQGTALKSTVESWGEHSEALMDQLMAEGLPPWMYYAASYNDTALGTEISAAIALGNDLGKSIPGETKTLIKSSLQAAVGPFAALLSAGDWTGGSQQTINDLLGVAEKVTLLRTQSGMDPQTAAQSVLQEMIGDVYAEARGAHVKAYVPRRYKDAPLDAEQIKQGANELLSPTGLDKLDIGTLNIVGAGFDLENEIATRRYVQLNGLWVTDESADGMMLMIPTSRSGTGYPVPVYDSAGKPIRRSWFELEKLGQPVVDEQDTVATP